MNTIFNIIKRKLINNSNKNTLIKKIINFSTEVIKIY
jgi:hypothetical protein